MHPLRKYDELRLFYHTPTPYQFKAVSAILMGDRKTKLQLQMPLPTLVNIESSVKILWPRGRRISDPSLSLKQTFQHST